MNTLRIERVRNENSKAQIILGSGCAKYSVILKSTARDFIWMSEGRTIDKLSDRIMPTTYGDIFTQITDSGVLTKILLLDI